MKSQQPQAASTHADGFTKEVAKYLMEDYILAHSFTSGFTDSELQYLAHLYGGRFCVPNQTKFIFWFARIPS